MNPGLKKFIKSWLINTFAVLVAVIALRPHLECRGVVEVFVASLLLGVLNAFIRPLLLLLALLEAQFHAKVGAPLRSVEAAERATRLGEETDSPLVAYELAVLRMKIAKRDGDGVRAEKARAVALEIAEREEWAPRTERLSSGLVRD